MTADDGLSNRGSKGAPRLFNFGPEPQECDLNEGVEAVREQRLRRGQLQSTHNRPRPARPTAATAATAPTDSTGMTNASASPCTSARNKEHPRHHLCRHHVAKTRSRRRVLAVLAPRPRARRRPSVPDAHRTASEAASVPRDSTATPNATASAKTSAQLQLWSRGNVSWTNKVL
ncbi:hypothetical protein MTO96_041771 [Rhipicephalus appendiculatus]